MSQCVYRIDNVFSFVDQAYAESRRLLFNYPLSKAQVALSHIRVYHVIGFTDCQQHIVNGYN